MTSEMYIELSCSPKAKRLGLLSEEWDSVCGWKRERQSKAGGSEWERAAAALQRRRRARNANRVALLEEGDENWLVFASRLS